MKAMIFAAGLGKRLGAITESVPKALVEINGKTALRLAVEKCSWSGFSDIIVNVHHFAGKVEEEVENLRKSGFTITVSDERNELLETGGGLFKAKDFFDDKPFLIYNVDILSDIDLKLFYDYHLSMKGIVTLAVRHRPGNRFFLINSSGRLYGWRNNSTGEEIISGSCKDSLTEIAFSGIHIADPEIFKYMKCGKYSLKDLYLEIADVHPVYTYLNDEGYWIDIGTPQNLEEARKILK
jgi:MurNAc alpha-1-phosphate uridylyltransferase